MNASKRPSIVPDFVLYPNRLRIGFIYGIAFAFAMAFGLLVRFIFTGGVFNAELLFGDWKITVLMIVSGAVLFAFLDYGRWTIRVVDGDQLEGPSGAFGDRMTIPIQEIDWTRTMRSLRSGVKIGNGIYTQARRRILISPWFYDPDKFKQFADIIGMPA